MARKTAGLSETDVAELRRDVEAGKRPRVFATAASGLDAGTSGQILSVGDPAEREFLLVRIGGDELPFAPEDLSRTRAATTGTTASRARTAPRRPSREPQRPAAGPSVEPVTQGRPRTAEAPAATGGEPSGAAQASPQPPAQAATPDAPAPGERTAAQPRPRRGQRGPASLAVTVRYADGRWTVEAARGAKTVVKATPVRAGHALHLIEQLEMPAVTDLVADAVHAGRADAERRATELREQLAAAEAELADYERRPAGRG